MAKPIARLNALEMTVAVLIADRAASSRDVPGWLKDRKAIVLRTIADSEQAVLDEIGTADGITEMHTAAAEIFDEARDILKRIPPPPNVGEAPGD
jgi:hypothetical protein